LRLQDSLTHIIIDSRRYGTSWENGVKSIFLNFYFSTSYVLHITGKIDLTPFFLGKYSDILIGHSQIAVPFKDCIKKLDHNKEEMFIQEIDTAILKIAEESYKIKEDLQKRAFY